MPAAESTMRLCPEVDDMVQTSDVIHFRTTAAWRNTILVLLYLVRTLSLVTLCSLQSKRPRVEDKTKIIAKRFVMINSETVLTAGVMSLNFLSAVGIVLVNKALFQWGDGLKFSTLLTAAHFFATAAGIRVCHSLGMYEIKPLKQSQASQLKTQQSGI